MVIHKRLVFILYQKIKMVKFSININISISININIYNYFKKIGFIGYSCTDVTASDLLYTPAGIGSCDAFTTFGLSYPAINESCVKIYVANYIGTNSNQICQYKYNPLSTDVYIAMKSSGVTTVSDLEVESPCVPGMDISI